KISKAKTKSFRSVFGIRDSVNVHGNNTITHLEWNDSGDLLASVDNSGIIAIWEMQKNVCTKWVLKKSFNVGSRIVCFKWFHEPKVFKFKFS
ncbi:hypothetical protein HK096_008591, partial [Nowakowskiella sp. JEL0078]